MDREQITHDPPGRPPLMPLIVPIALLLVFGVPAIVSLEAVGWKDVVRAVVLSMTVVTSGLYFATIINICWHILGYDWPDHIVRQMAVARLARVVGCLVFMLVGAVDVVQRFGTRDLAVYTPVLALTNVLFLVAWIWLDVRRWAAP